MNGTLEDFTLVTELLTVHKAHAIQVAVELTRNNRKELKFDDVVERSSS